MINQAVTARLVPRKAQSPTSRPVLQFTLRKEPRMNFRIRQRRVSRVRYVFRTRHSYRKPPFNLI